MKYLTLCLFFLSLSSVAESTQNFIHSVITEEEALSALRAISAPVTSSSNRCLGCHDPNMRTIHEWGKTATWRVKYCLEYVPESGVAWGARDKLRCLRGTDDEAVAFKASRLGFLAAGAHSKMFKDIFVEVYGAVDGETKHKKFVKEAGMPKGHGAPISEEEFDHLYRWAKSDLVYFDRLLAEEIPPQTACVPERSTELDHYLKRRELSNWTLYHQDRGTKFFGCQDGVLTEFCFTEKVDNKDKYPETKTKYFSRRWNSDSSVAMRLIAKLPKASIYWTRGSPDGRYLGLGLYAAESVTNSDGTKKEYRGMLLDLKESSLSGSNSGTFLVDASYDPTFTPDGLGFMFNGLNDGKAGVCPLSVLLTPEGKTVEFDESGCLISKVYTYQSMGTSLEGEGSYVMTGIYEGDDAGGPYTRSRDAVPKWGVRSFIEFIHMPFIGNQYQVSSRLNEWTPFYGDWALSASTELLASRVAGVDAKGNPTQLGFQFFLMNHQNSKLEMRPALKVCEKGSKGTFSMDERYFVYHHYVEESDYQELGFQDRNDPDFQAMLETPTANIYLTDLYTGHTKRLTKMEFGQVAAFPHFRADGWLYFLVRDQATKTEWLTGAHWMR